MVDLAKARELEQLRYIEALNRLNLEEQERIRKQNADFAAQGLFQSGARLAANAQARVHKIGSVITERLEIRKELAKSFPELGSDSELDALMSQISPTLENATNAVLQNVPPGAARSALKEQVDQEIYRLKADTKVKIEILKREFALKLNKKQEPPSVSVETGGGAALVNLGTIYGNVQQVIGDVNGAGYGELADLLQRLAKAIRESETLGDERRAYLEQVEFIARQATEPVERRQASVVKGLFVGLRARLEDAAHLAAVLTLVGPAMARHFGITWPF